ncbi:hypothetical protein PUMCH_004700 [Australozyma saopauloensis]|uniref:Uncharacterized protein n=1 Tax=Australozyma saopauloensis TaxID=291208 RepID=A0AAX4HG75_9ASCO|nr:hypothetical protein PUMCH_004700 [[Candida] saopauloensis]
MHLQPLCNLSTDLTIHGSAGDWWQRQRWHLSGERYMKKQKKVPQNYQGLVFNKLSEIRNSPKLFCILKSLFSTSHHLCSAPIAVTQCGTSNAANRQLQPKDGNPNWQSEIDVREKCFSKKKSTNYCEICSYSIFPTFRIIPPLFPSFLAPSLS